MTIIDFLYLLLLERIYLYHKSSCFCNFIENYCYVYLEFKHSEKLIKKIDTIFNLIPKKIDILWENKSNMVFSIIPCTGKPTSY